MSRHSVFCFAWATIRPPPRLLRGFHIDELLSNGESFGGGIGSQQLQLGGYRKPLALLVFAAHASVDHSHACRTTDRLGFAGGFRTHNRHTLPFDLRLVLLAGFPTVTHFLIFAKGVFKLTAISSGA